MLVCVTSSPCPPLLPLPEDLELQTQVTESQPFNPGTPPCPGTHGWLQLSFCCCTVFIISLLAQVQSQLQLQHLVSSAWYSKALLWSWLMWPPLSPYSCYRTVLLQSGELPAGKSPSTLLVPICSLYQCYCPFNLCSCFKVPLKCYHRLETLINKLASPGGSSEPGDCRQSIPQNFVPDYCPTELILRPEWKAQILNLHPSCLPKTFLQLSPLPHQSLISLSQHYFWYIHRQLYFS